MTHAYGHDIALDAFRLPPDGIVVMLNNAGLALQNQLLCRRSLKSRPLALFEK
ncbi:hypothetical protein SAMN05216282_105128 [Cryobacterium psychrotolerans]|uniref:Uncharacterized protein n=1 Tax=Cryobacterium psychrotolerans TaxID=386301 RepID=A0A1G9BBV6_9MICO|nr:hypothetical protein SAMN05216282_105128 [Cryobacterium psychrotolerans]